ncbi:MAG: hypothetical protein AAB438_01955 [Patescibacteria group bacterium]
MINILTKLEKFLVKDNSECQFDLQYPRHLLILPGLGGYVGRLFPLVRYLRKGQSNYGVTAIPLGLNSASLSVIITNAIKNIEENLFQKNKPEKIIFLGHSFGGRVACMLVNELKNKYPEIIYEVVTLGSPVGSLRIGYLPWYKEMLFSCFSNAYKDGDLIIQPESEINKYIGYYSIDDKLVYPEFAKNEHKGTLKELKGFSHNDLISPKKIGAEILSLLVR